MGIDAVVFSVCESSVIGAPRSTARGWRGRAAAVFAILSA
jgi:hypothetical protein